MSEGGEPLRRLHGIQYLRAFAALCVLTFHAIRPTGAPLGFLSLGVDLFFVLSGFLMVAITDERSRPLPFFRDRFLRVVPIYWIVTLCALLMFLSGKAGPLQSDAWHLFASFAFIPAQHPSSSYLFPLVPPGWTLNYEMLFYTLFAMLLVLPRRAQVWTLAALLFSAVLFGRIVQPDDPILRAWTHPILLEFLAGIWLGRAWQQGRRLWPILLASIPLTVAAFYLLTSPDGWWHGRILVIPILLALLVGVLTLERRGGGIPNWRIPRLLGDASYSIYLWQFFAVAAARFAQVRFGLPEQAAPIFIFCTGLVGGIVAYFLVERPLLKLFARRKRYRHGAPIPGGV